jgi:ethanolamine ammonia-lyase small subunit
VSAVVPPDPWNELMRLTPARIALGRTGVSMPTREVLAFAHAHARARDAVTTPFDSGRTAHAVEALGLKTFHVHSAATDRASYLRRPDLGRRLSDESCARLTRIAGEACDLAIVIADGLSSAAIHAHAANLLDALAPAIEAASWRSAPIVLAGQARVALGDEVGEILKARIVVLLVGERPGLSSPDSLGAYITFAPHVGRADADRNCVSNIRGGGLSYAEAAEKIAWLVREGLRLGFTGVALKDENELKYLLSWSANITSNISN